MRAAQLSGMTQSAGYLFAPTYDDNNSIELPVVDTIIFAIVQAVEDNFAQGILEQHPYTNFVCDHESSKNEKEVDRRRQCEYRLCRKEYIMLHDLTTCPKNLLKKYLETSRSEKMDKAAVSCNK